MFALFIFVLIIALAVALAPIILGVIGTMLGLFLTFCLWAFAGFPDNAPKDTRPAASQHGPADRLRPGERMLAPDPAWGDVEPTPSAIDHFDAWEREDAERNRAYRQKARLLDAQKRVHHDD